MFYDEQCIPREPPCIPTIYGACLSEEEQLRQYTAYLNAISAMLKEHIAKSQQKFADIQREFLEYEKSGNITANRKLDGQGNFTGTIDGVPSDKAMHHIESQGQDIENIIGWLNQQYYRLMDGGWFESYWTTCRINYDMGNFKDYDNKGCSYIPPFFPPCPPNPNPQPPHGSWFPFIPSHPPCNCGNPEQVQPTNVIPNCPKPNK